MSATTLAGTIRYLPPGIRQVYKVPTIAVLGAPTRLELDAGTDITKEIVDGSMSGWKTSGSTAEVPDLGSKTTRKVQGRTSLDDSAFALYLSKTGTGDARTLFNDSDLTNIVIFPEGDHVGMTLNVFSVQVLTSSVDPDTTKPGQLPVEFAIMDLAKNVTVPA